MTRSPGRRLFRAVAVAAAVAVATLVAAELALRAAALVAGERIERLRDDPALVADADVAVYGDSTPFGLGANTSFPAELARATGLRVVNRSRPALNSSQTLLVMRDDLERFRPRLVVVMTGVNDVWNRADLDPDLLPPEEARWRRLPELRLLRLARIWLRAGPGASAFESVEPDRRGWREREPAPARRFDADAIAATTGVVLARIVELARAKGIDLLFLGYQAPGWNGSADAVDELLARDHGDRTVALRPLFEGEGAKMILPDAFHPTDEGHRRISERLRDELETRGLPARGDRGGGDAAGDTGPAR